LSGNAYENIENSVLEELVICDTIPVKQMIDKLKVVSVAGLFAVAIRNAYENKSINSLFLRSKMLKKNKAKLS
jgi:ribose-phosphate pyrophosphokinase